MGWILECWGSWLMSLQRCSLCSLGLYGDQKRWLMTGERQTPHPSSKNIAKRITETSGPLTSPSVPGKIMEKTFLETIPSHMKDKKWVATATMDLLRTNHATLTQLLPSMRWLWWMRGEQWLLYADFSNAFVMVCHRILTASCGTTSGVVSSFVLPIQEKHWHTEVGLPVRVWTP